MDNNEEIRRPLITVCYMLHISEETFLICAQDSREKEHAATGPLKGRSIDETHVTQTVELQRHMMHSGGSKTKRLVLIRGFDPFGPITFVLALIGRRAAFVGTNGTPPPTASLVFLTAS